MIIKLINYIIETPRHIRFMIIHWARRCRHYFTESTRVRVHRATRILSDPTPPTTLLFVPYTCTYSTYHTLQFQVSKDTKTENLTGVLLNECSLQVPVGY
jgi:hypothetical protein